MKKLLLFVSLLTVFSFSIQAQTADEIINHYLENIGGQEKLAKLKGLHVKTKVLMQGMEIPVEMFMYNNGAKLVKMTFQGKEITQMAFDGEQAWGTNMMNQKAEKLDKETTDNLKINAKGEFPNPFLNYKKKGYKVELLGKEEIEGTECFKIKLTELPTMKNGKEIPSQMYYYFDTENYVPIVVETEITEGPYQGKKTQQVYSDYQEVDGLYFPFATTMKLGGNAFQTIKIDKIELNPEFNKANFKFPEESNKETKKQEK